MNEVHIAYANIMHSITEIATDVETAFVKW